MHVLLKKKKKISEVDIKRWFHTSSTVSLNRKSFEFEDVVRWTAQQGSRETEGRRSGLYHTRSQDSIYEDIIGESWLGLMNSEKEEAKTHA